MSHRINLQRIKAVHSAADNLREKVIYVDGATVSLYATARVEEVRPTDDVDILIELLVYREYAELEDRLRSLGFVNDMESGIIGRYEIQGIIVDIIATNPGGVRIWQ